MPADTRKEGRESRIKSLHGRARATIGGRAVSPAYTDLLAFVRGAAPGHSCICSRLCALPSSPANVDKTFDTSPVVDKTFDTSPNDAVRCHTQLY